MTSLAADIEAAAQIGADEGGVSRFAWTPELAQANEWFMARFQQLGLEANVDLAGNVGTAEGTIDVLKPKKRKRGA